MKKLPVALSLHQLCSYQELTSTTNYASDAAIQNTQFNLATYQNLLHSYQANDRLTTLLHTRSSKRHFSQSFIPLSAIKKILFNAYALKNASGSYTIPQAGGLAIMQLHVLANCHNHWQAYHYHSQTYQLTPLTETVKTIANLFYSQHVDYSTTSHCIIISANIERLACVYLNRGYKFACIQAGHIAQNIVLSATANQFASTCLGSLIEEPIKSTCNLEEKLEPLYAVILGHAP